MKIKILAIALLMASLLSGQDDHLQFRFSNLNYDFDENVLSVDIEIFTPDDDMALYAMNTRLFYEADLINFSSYSDFKEGYGFITDGDNKPFIGGEKSARNMFGSEGRAGYINTGIEMSNVSVDVRWKKGEWERLVRLNYTIDESILENKASLCPAFIWDQGSGDQNSYLMGSMGVTSTIIIKKSNTDVKCSSAHCAYFDMNYNNTSIEAPFGIVLSDMCISNLTTPTINLELTTELNVYQNTPNPFSDQTIIEFNLPRSADVKLTIFDVSGVLIMERNENFSAGQNSFSLKDTKLRQNTYMYQLSTSEYSSPYFKMIKID